ncbi:MAG: F0F1 ATP synthase subunit delta [Candidatus Eremiobacteraeota bacterium]|nr:F0F1 ATP synthase subunit delta [Candidatus Eremiobacteraeota bacterium]
MTGPATASPGSRAVPLPAGADARAEQTPSAQLGSSSRAETVSRNYAETLFALATRAGDIEGWGRMAQEIVDALHADPRLRLFLESPRVSAEHKTEMLGRAFQDRYPRMFVRFFQTLVTKGRQRLLGEIVAEYQALVDEAEGRVHAEVTLAAAPSEADRAALAASLSRVLGKQVMPHVTVNPAIIGGVIVKMGDTVMDGSVRKRLATLRRALMRPAVARQ